MIEFIGGAILLGLGLLLEKERQERKRQKVPVRIPSRGKNK